MVVQKKSEKLYKFIQKFEKRNQRFPDKEVMMNHMEVSDKRVYQILKELVDEGLIEKTGRYGFDIVK